MAAELGAPFLELCLVIDQCVALGNVAREAEVLEHLMAGFPGVDGVRPCRLQRVLVAGRVPIGR